VLLSVLTVLAVLPDILPPRHSVSMPPY
jgi:hypothetical protein